jgi:riboflavin synthase alpha subunit
MFTGLVEALGTVEELADTGAGRRLRVRCGSATAWRSTARA